MAPSPSSGLLVGIKAMWPLGRRVVVTSNKQTLEFSAEKGLLIKDALTQKTDVLGLSQIHLASWLGHKVFKGKKK